MVWENNFKNIFDSCQFICQQSKKNTLHEWKKRFLFPWCFTRGLCTKTNPTKPEKVTSRKTIGCRKKKKNACVHRKFASQKPSTSNDVIEHNNKYHLIIGPPPQVRSKATRGIFHQDVFQGSFSLKQESKHVVIIIHWKYVEFMYVHYRYCIWYTC